MMAEFNVARLDFHPAETTVADLPIKREREGRCAHCGAQTHKLSWVTKKKTPLNIPGEVHRGRCLLCNPLQESSPPQPTNDHNTDLRCSTEEHVSPLLFKVGDTVPSRVANSATPAIKTRLQLADAAFVKRSDGRWTYAIVQDIQPRSPPTFLFQVTAHTAKEFTESMLSTSVRTLPPSRRRSSTSSSQSYQIGDVANTHDLNEACAAYASSLDVNDAAFVERSDGRWTYAILGKINPSTPSSLVFSLDQSMTKECFKESTKSIPESEWASMVRCAIPPLPPPLPLPLKSSPPTIPTATATSALRIGDAAPHSIIQQFDTIPHISAYHLNVGDAAFVQRTDGRWTYATVKRIDPGPSLVFNVQEEKAIGPTGETTPPLEKSFPEATWESYVRCVPSTTTAVVAPGVSVAESATATTTTTTTTNSATTYNNNISVISYTVGDIVAQEDVDRALSAIDCQLSVGDTAFVQLSDGCWTCAIVESIDSGGLFQQQQQCIVCRVSCDGLPLMTKSFMEDSWALSVRSAPSPVL